MATPLKIFVDLFLSYRHPVMIYGETTQEFF